MSSSERLPRLGTGDHLEVDLGFAAGVTDRGVTHRRNEDALHLEAVDGIGIAGVVCDGVSMSNAPDLAARAGAAAAGQALVDGLHQGGLRLDGLVLDALRVAQRAVAAVADSTRSDLAPPSCTLVSGVCAHGEVAVSWVGDSRAYWVTGGVAVQLTTDNSWAWEQVESGRMTEHEAGGHPQGQQITAWLGVDAPHLAAQIVTFRPHGAGRLVLCSDGLWGWLPSLEHLARLVGDPLLDLDLLVRARQLVDLAVARGGGDDITVAIINVGSRDWGRR